MPENDWALLPPEPCMADIKIDNEKASVCNGKIRAQIDKLGNISFYDQKNKLLLNEYVRNRRDIHARTCSPLEISGREFKPLIGGNYEITLRFESICNDEKIYGMGQYQQPQLNLKGCVLELAQRNTQASVPFMISSLGYGFLWNNPGIGRVSFGKNFSIWEARSAKIIDYWITAGSCPAEIEEAYARVTGTVPMMPDYAAGFWQCKLRYRTQEELLKIARTYKERGIPISVIVIDFFHWPHHGEWKFDLRYWPDPDAMVRELKDMGIELMVSIWPTVERQSENWDEMLQKGYLIRTERGYRITLTAGGDTIYYDATNPDACSYVWNKVKKNYYDRGIKLFWLDAVEPATAAYTFDNNRFFIGTEPEVGNIFPLMIAKAFYEGLKEAGQEKVINLIRCAWAGSQRYGALAWSGDIHSDFETLRNQIVAGLNMGIAGIPWWNTDIGGFYGGNIEDPRFHELLIRWFEWGCFCPVMRLHGDREPHKPNVETDGVRIPGSGADNEIWSFTDEVYTICKKYVLLREKLRPYIMEQMKAAHEKGTPVIRPLFYDFPTDSEAWEIEDEYMFGPNYLVAPVVYEGKRERSLYLPTGSAWTNAWTGETFEGGHRITIDAPLDIIPVFSRDGTKLLFRES
jgi:alpha-D-xyloside xylohydrolase